MIQLLNPRQIGNREAFGYDVVSGTGQSRRLKRRDLLKDNSSVLEEAPYPLSWHKTTRPIKAFDKK